MNTPLVRFSAFYVIGGLLLIGGSAFLIDMTTAEALLITWVMVGIPLFLVVFGRLNRDTSDNAALMYLVGLAMLGLLLLFGLYRLWPLLQRVLPLN